MVKSAKEGRIELCCAAVIKELQTGTFETILGQVKLENKLYKQNWWVGQWRITLWCSHVSEARIIGPLAFVPPTN
jgi:hypothetical protein